MCQLQRTLIGSGLPELVAVLQSSAVPPLPPLPEKLPLYCSYCGNDALAFDAKHHAVCAQCYFEAATVCEQCGATYLDDCCPECEVACEQCGEVILRDDGRTSDDGEHYCEECYSDLFTSCDHCNDEVAVDDLQCHDDSCYCEACFDELFAACSDCGETVSHDDAIAIDRHQSICRSCYDDNYFTCERCEIVRHFDQYGVDGCCCDCESEHRQDFDAVRFRPSDNSVSRTGSLRRFGVELETSSCDNYLELDGEVCFSSQDDGSIAGKEFVSEVLCGDVGLIEIEKFCKRAGDLDFGVNSSCGCHLHVDVSDLTAEQLKSVAIAYRLTYDLWASFVSPSRRSNRYCGHNGWDVESVMNCECFSDFARGQDRYQWFNIRAYCKHSTFEIRLHSGTLNGEKICNWIVTHLRFVEAMAALPSAEVVRLFANGSTAEHFLRCCDFWPSDAIAYLRLRAAQFGTVLPLPELAAV